MLAVGAAAAASAAGAAVDGWMCICVGLICVNVCCCAMLVLCCIFQDNETHSGFLDCCIELSLNKDRMHFD